VISFTLGRLHLRYLDQADQMISLFSPATSDDGKHDIALSSRIAAMNMLDLSLEHLGVVVKETTAEPGKEAELAERNRRVEEGLQKMIEHVGNRKSHRFDRGM
jgi:hypothetical protein